MRSGVSKAGAWVHRAILIGGDAVILLGAFHLGLEYWVRKVGPNAGEFYPAAIICLVAYLLTLSMFDLYDIQRNYRDRKSTRLNSSHLVISYAVFCLKKKKIQAKITKALLSDRSRITYPATVGSSAVCISAFAAHS